jgi:hypothetical protein
MAQVAPIPRRVEIPKLHVFISYASEDAVLAQAINAELKTSFSQAMIRTTLDSEIKLGADWRTRLEEALSDARNSAIRIPVSRWGSSARRSETEKG